MILTLSPAKLQDFVTPVSLEKQSEPLFSVQTAELADELKCLSLDDVENLMSLNSKQAIDVYQNIQAFDLCRTSQKQAALAYNGIAYKGLDAKSFDKEDWIFAQKHLLMISGLYGMLRPLDIIKPYRLEFAIKLKNSRGKDLYQYWNKRLSQYFIKRLDEDDKIWLNLASAEYTKAIDSKMLPEGIKIITVSFKEETLQGPRMKVVYAKKARGMMARYIIKNKITRLEDVKSFDAEGYAFSPLLSDDTNWVFLR